MRGILRRLRSFFLSFEWTHSDRVLESLLLEANRMRAAGVAHTRAEWDALSPIERAALISADGSVVNVAEPATRTRSALESAAGVASRRLA